MDHQRSLQTRLREHVKKRGSPTIPNGAWDMMLEAAERIDDLETEVKDLREEIRDLSNIIGKLESQVTDNSWQMEYYRSMRW